MRRLSEGLLLVVAFAIPWENLVIFDQLGSLVRVLGMVAASVGVCAVLLDGRLRKFGPVLVLAALWVLWGGLSLFWSIEADSTVDRVLTYVQLLGLMWLMWEFGADAASRSALTQAYVFGAYVSLVGTLLGFASGAQLDAKRYTTGTFNVNDLGLTFALGIPMAWYLVLTQQNRILRWINQAYVPAAVVGVLLTASRGAFVATVIATSMVVGSMSKLPLRTKLLALLLITSALIAAAFVVPQSSWQRLAQGQQSLQRWDLTGRTAIWEEGLHVLRTLWTDGEISFQGRHFDYDGVAFHSGTEMAPLRPLQSPPPIWVVSNPRLKGDAPPEIMEPQLERACRRIVEHGDGWMTCCRAQHPEEFVDQLGLIERYADEHGHDFSRLVMSYQVTMNIADSEDEARSAFDDYISKYYPELSKAMDLSNWGPVGTPEQIAEWIRTFAAAGVDHFICRFGAIDQFGQVQRFAEEVLPVFSAERVR